MAQFKSEEFHVVKNQDGSYTVSINGDVQSNAKGAMRQIAEAIGFEYDPAWTTQQFGSKLSKALGESSTHTAAPQQESKVTVKNDTATADAEQVRIAEEQAKAAAMQAAALAEAKAASEKAKAAAEKQKAEAEAAKAELERLKAETAKAKAEAEAAKAAAEKAQVEAAKAAVEKAAAEKTKASSSSAANAKGVLPGLFSVSENKKVHFSKGNLQFNAAKYEFRFAEHQWDICGKHNEKIASNYDGWIDLFGYGTSGYMGCQPYEYSEKSDQYPSGDIANTDYDWGKYNPISNGGNKEGLWRTLTKDEWSYLINDRPNALKLRAKACVNGVEGLVILPDDFFEKRIRVSYDATPDNYSDNSYSTEQWKTMEDAGVVFLPRAGYRYSQTYMGGGYIWTSDEECSSRAFKLNIAEITISYSNKLYGEAVRLVSE